MAKAFNDALKNVREKKIGYITKQLDFIFKNLIKKFDGAAAIEEEKKNAYERRNELAAEFKAKQRNSIQGLEYISF